MKLKLVGIGGVDITKKNKKTYSSTYLATRQSPLYQSYWRQD